MENSRIARSSRTLRAVCQLEETHMLAPAFTAATLAEYDPDLAQALEAERVRQETHLELIASENYASPQVLAANGSVLSNKYAEGYPGRRYYGGCQHVDVVEQLAIDRAKKLFGCGYANVQPHSGSQANQAVMLATCKPGDTILGMSLPAGGHLSHGTKVNISGKYFNALSYGLEAGSEQLDYADLADKAREHKPKLIISGASAYSLPIDWQRIRAVADEVGAFLLADIAHYSGLIAAGLYPSPLGIAHFVTTTTHKILRGPRGGLILSGEEHAKKLNSAIFPGLQGGPLLPMIAGKAVAFREAMRPEYKEYCAQIISNAKAFADELVKLGLRIVSGGTECHMFLVDLTAKDVTGSDAEESLDRAHITLNKNAIPADPRPPRVTSGIRIGTPALTTRGLREEDCRRVANLMVRVIDSNGDSAVETAVAQEVVSICEAHPVYPHTA